ncbi:MAG: ABC transporter substrate-binding protein [Chloroflexi bacterium]|nr:ABC transporter substrate-binding protein [Chloroflexota bacterium]
MSTERLTRRDFLRWTTLTAVGVAAAACAKPAEPVAQPTTAPAQPTAAPAQPTAAPAKPTDTPAPVAKFSEAPALAEQVKAGKLPPVDERLPEDPRVVTPIEKVGKYGGEWRMGTLGTADNAIFTRNTWYEGMLRWNVEWTEVVPGVVKSWEVGADGKEFTWNLRKGMKWSDGAPFTAEDMAFWFEKLTNTELNPVFSKTLSTGSDPMQFTKIDDYTIKYTFKAPYGLLLQRMACPSSEWFSPKHYEKQFYPAYADKDALAAKVKAAGVDNWFQAYGAWIDPKLNPEQPVVYAWLGTSKLGDGTQWICQRNPYFYCVDTEGNQLPYIDRQVYAVAADAAAIGMMALAGELAYQDRHVATLANKPLFMENAQKIDIRFVDTQGSSMNACTIALNWTHKDPALRELIQNKDFRIALSVAINRQEIIDIIGLGIGEPWQWAPLRQSPLFNETLAKQYTEYDPAKANQLLDGIVPKKDAEGMRLRPDGQQLGFVMENSNINSDMLDMVVKYWKDVGIRCLNKLEDRSLLYERKRANECDIAIWGGDGGMDVILEPRWYFPYSEESNYAMDWVHWYTSAGKEGSEPIEPAKKQMELYDKLLITPDLEDQNDIMREILKIAEEQFWGIGLYVGGPGYAIVKNKFRNVPQKYWGSWLYPNPGPLNPCQFFWDA